MCGDYEQQSSEEQVGTIGAADTGQVTLIITQDIGTS